jgi:dihydroxyacetone kinase
MGIHNEPGTATVLFRGLTRLVEDMLQQLTDVTDEDRYCVPLKCDGTDEVVLLVNNLGGLSQLEIAAVANACTTWLVARQVKIRRTIAGTLLSSIDMPGFSLTLLSLSSTPSGSHTADSLLKLLEAPTTAPSWPRMAAENLSLQSLEVDHRSTGNYSGEISRLSGQF